MVALIFVEAWALELCVGKPLICLFRMAYPPYSVSGIFPFPSVTDDALDFIFEFGGAVLFFLFTGRWL